MTQVLIVEDSRITREAIAGRLRDTGEFEKYKDCVALDKAAALLKQMLKEKGDKGKT